MKNAILSLTLLALAGCASGGVSAPAESEVLWKTEEVAVVTLTVDAGGKWAVKNVKVGLGFPTSAIVRDRAVGLEVLDKGGSTLHALSIADPREVVVDDGKKSAKVRYLPAGEVKVALPYEEAMESIRLVGQTPRLKDMDARVIIGDAVRAAGVKFRAAPVKLPKVRGGR